MHAAALRSSCRFRTPVWFSLYRYFAADLADLLRQEFELLHLAISGNMISGSASTPSRLNSSVASIIAAGLRTVDFRVADAQTRAAMAEHRIELARFSQICFEALRIDTHIDREFANLLVVLRQELV